MIKAISIVMLEALALSVAGCLLYEKVFERQVDGETVSLITLSSLIVVLVANWIVKKIRKRGDGP